MPVNRATNVGITLRQFNDCSIADIRRDIVTGQMKAERVSLLRMVLPCPRHSSCVGPALHVCSTKRS